MDWLVHESEEDNVLMEDDDVLLEVIMNGLLLWNCLEIEMIA